ncbi:glutamate receptor ionotropic, kainate 3-like isoform X2 [Contarinia nasturtii]|uniref:glutamate receptor ionotropic, kainate 3-like isoform X2 n=1 Tax=Contarinia nasturtii TaxID=265458 RepID=UPI0012D42C98|nr:glutamate receptor ionotropic, kainate 3-like isoform X2 [Contarinia nasturtii]
MNINIYFYLILIVFPIKYCYGGVFLIGAAFDYNNRLNTAILEYAVKRANKNILNEAEVSLKTLTEPFDYGNEFEAARSVCSLFESGSYAIIGPKSLGSKSHIANICDAKEIPYIDTYMDVEAKTSTINLYPSHETLSQLLIEVVNKYEWKDILILYEAPSYIKRISPFLEDRNRKPGTVTVQPIEVGGSFQNILQKVKDMGSRSSNIIIESSIEHLSEILEQALQVGLFGPERSFIITNLDAQTIDLSKFQYTQANITIFRIIDRDFPIEEFKDIDDYLEYERDKCKIIRPCTDAEFEELSPPFVLQTNTALIYDAVMILAEALKQIGFEHLQMNDNRIDCSDPESTWSKGSTITNYMTSINYTKTTLTRSVVFDRKRLRSDVEIDLMSLDGNGLNKIGIYNQNTANPNSTNQLVFLPKPVKATDPNEYRPIREMTFTVLVGLTDPYIMLKDTSVGLQGNERYEGFGIDIIYELSKEFGFNYELKELPKGEGYGDFNNATGTWNGMIGALRNGSVDLAITDLTINSERITAIDFTPSFMNLGIALLYRKPIKEAPETFSFMLPFSMSVWALLGAAYITVSLCFFCLGRISASQWENRYPCIEEPTYLENQFTLNNSCWFAAGALLQQGSEIEPKAASIRLASSFWWFFTLIMVASYTANLATFLVIENKKPEINSVEDLMKNESGKITFGAKKNGATLNFFKSSTNQQYQDMYKYMETNEYLLTDDNVQGIARVYKGDEHYAFLMESSSISYEIERKCNLTQVGDPIDDKNYGIGMRKHFPYHPQLSEGILKLQEKGKLAELQKKWWKERKGGGACADDIDDGQAVPLEMANVAGVFYVLIVGTIFAICYGICGLIMEIHIRAKRHKIPFKEELIAELKFLMTCQGVKEVRHRKGSKSQCSGTSNQSNQSRYSENTNGSNALLRLR